MRDGLRGPEIGLGPQAVPERVEAETMATMAGILNRLAEPAQALMAPAATPKATAGSGTASAGAAAGSNAASVSANDFLTLLVTEMQNQDPTSSTDPNQYINQLVQVNSLEQLISINQNLTTALGSSATKPVGGASGNGASAQVSPAAGSRAGSVPAEVTLQSGPAAVATGNLSAPDVKPAALRVAQALGGLPGAR